ncbi:EamA family transporter [Actinomadura flavalba]|uniref:EamA family transporter n=1 Tax=Actinomadura flavalba TaxID=1120938 RepID=UPI00037731E8|nr:DMT family transporter [Actinomadura flavalba]
MDGTARLRAHGLAFMLLSSVCFGASGPFGKALIEAGLTSWQAVWLRIAGAALVLLPVALLARGRAGLRSARAHAPQLVAYGFTAVAGAQALYFLAASRLPVGIAILLEFTGPLLVLVWTRVVRRAAVPRSAVAGVAVALIGLALVVRVWTGLDLDALGLAAGIGSAACAAGYFLLLDHLGSAVDPLVTTAAGTCVAAVALAVPATPWSLPWDVLPGRVDFAGTTAPGWLLVAVIVLVSTVVAYLAGAAGVRRLSAPIAGAVAYTETVAATLIAWAVLGETLTPVQIAGGLTVLTGAYLAQRAVTPGTAPAAQPTTPPVHTG